MDNIWFAHYQKGVVHDIQPEQYPSLLAWFDDCCQRYADRIAYIHEGSALTFREVEEHSRHFAIFLKEILPFQTPVGIILPNLLQYPVVLFGILRAGCIVVNTNPLYTADEWTYQLQDARVEVVVLLSQLATRFVPILPQLPHLKTVVLTEVGDLFWPLKRFLINTYFKWTTSTPVPHFSQAIPFRQALAQGKTKPFTPPLLNPDHLAFLQYTGGTTGLSKGAMLTHRNMVANLLQTAAWVAPISFDATDKIITALPLYHIFSLLANALLFFHLGIANLLISDPRQTKRLISTIRRAQITIITGVNTLFNALLNHPDWATVDATRFKIALTGGMALQEAVAKKWEQCAGRALIEAYGLTEASPAISINPLNLAHYQHSIGLPLPSTEIAIRDETGHDLPLHEPGELCVRGPQIMAGYWQQPHETQQVFWPDGFLRTGDRAYLDDQGYLYLVDRIKDMILISGFNVYPNEIEQVLQQHPGVLEVGVIGVRTPTGNEAIKACVVKRDETLSEDDLLTYAKAHLTSYKIPKIIAFYTELPKTNVGKILRRALS